MPHLESWTMPLSPLAGGRELPLRGGLFQTGSQRVAASHSVCAQPAACPGATSSGPGSASDGVRRRPAAASAEARVFWLLLGSQLAGVRCVRMRFLAWRRPGAAWSVLGRLGCDIDIARLLPFKVFRLPRRSRRDPRGSSSGAGQTRSDGLVFYHPKTPPCTVASPHASALPTSRARRSTALQKKPRAKP